MQRIGEDITERGAHQEYVTHLRARACACDPGMGALCPEGVRLHGLWRAAQEREQMGCGEPYCEDPFCLENQAMTEAELGEAVARGLDIEVRNATPRDELFLRLDSAEDE